MSTQEIANRLVELCRQGQNDTAYQELFADNAVAIEPEGAPQREIQGRNALLAKSAQFREMTEEVFEMSVSDPIVTKDHFAVSMLLDAKMQGRPRAAIEEICLYHVKDGKIAKEEFFYNMPMPS